MCVGGGVRMLDKREGVTIFNKKKSYSYLLLFGSEGGLKILMEKGDLLNQSINQSLTTLFVRQPRPYQVRQFLNSLKGVHKKTRQLKSLKCSKSKTIRTMKLKFSQPVYLMRQTGCARFSSLALSIVDLEHFKDLGGLIFLWTPFSFPKIIVLIPCLHC